MSILDANAPELIFKTEAEVKAFSRFFLKEHPQNVESEFESEQEYKDFLAKRERNLMVQLDHFREINFDKSNTQNIRDKYYKIALERHKKPLSSEGSGKKSSRFNFKDEDILKNNVVYFGRTQQCCEIEKFQLEYQLELINSNERDDLDIAFAPIEKSIVYEYDVCLDKVLVLTSKPSCDAINISLGAYRNEWFELNDGYEIPSSSQILGSIAKAQGYSGIMFTSIRMQTTPNLVIFEENTDKLEFTEISRKEFVKSNNLFQ